MNIRDRMPVRDPVETFEPAAPACRVRHLLLPT